MTPAPRMEVVRTPGAVRNRVRAWRRAGKTVAFVPTMGYFHEGHLSLMRRAARLADRVVVSIFVNPTQFGPGEDFATYPRNVSRDLALARAESVDLCFAPRAETLYAADRCTEVHVTGLEHVLEGDARPTHFGGVALIVLKLLHIVEPDLLVLGQKDAQQIVILERMIDDLDVPVRVVRGPIVRERDGLAMSSRNVRLGTEDRRAATVLWRALKEAQSRIRAGERDASSVETLVRETIGREPRARLDYVAVVDARTFVPLQHLKGNVIIPIAVHVGGTRLIDNLEIRVGRAS